LLGSTAYSVIRTAAIPVLLIRIEVAEGTTDGARCRALCTGLFRHILFPTDFSDTADRALASLEFIVRKTHSEVTLLHVQDQVKIERHLRHKLKEFNEIDTRRLDGIKARLEQGGATRVHIDIPYGSPTAVILDRARANDFTLIMMGSSGRAAIKEIFLGAVANNVARHASLPVLFVPGVRG
jgi:nucleotide-binding universal stress UspA family protein